MSLFKHRTKLANSKPLRQRRERVRLDEDRQAMPVRRARVRQHEEHVHLAPRRQRKHFGEPLTTRRMELAETHPNGVYLTTAQAAYFVGLSPKTLQNWRVKGNVGPAHVKHGSRVLYLYAELKRWAAAGARANTSGRR